jgi:hypothetical protein
MASRVQTPAAAPAAKPGRTPIKTQGFLYSALLLGWLIPGAGHLLTGRWVRALLLFLSISALFYGLSRMLGLGTVSIQLATADYGTKFIVVAGLLNFVAAVDAHNLRIGRKA